MIFIKHVNISHTIIFKAILGIQSVLIMEVRRPEVEVVVENNFAGKNSQIILKYAQLIIGVRIT